MGNFDGRYQMIGRLGEGGMGEVWLAHDEQLDNRPVAIKIMRAQLLSSAEDAARFDREMRLAAQMQHPNIVTVFTTGTFGGAPYMVMEYLEGHDLSRVPPAGGVDQAVAIGRETCGALAYAHERNVIHRDIKPGNLFLCKTGQTKVTDFGIAKAMTGTKLSSSGVLIGTFAYMAPELWLGEPAAFSNDIWAAGCALYGFLSGRLPRECATVGEYASAAVRREPIPDVRSVARIPDWLGGAVMAMLEPDPRNRPTAAQSLQLLSGSPSGSWQAGQAGPGYTSRATGPAVVDAPPWWGNGFSDPGRPSGPTPPPGYPSADGGGRGSGPVRRRKRGRLIAALAGMAVLLVAGLYVARGAILGSSGANTAAGNGSTPKVSTKATRKSSHATSPGSGASASASASALASSSVTASGDATQSTSAPPVTGSATLTGVTTQVDAGSAPSFTFSVQDLGSGESTVLQRTFGQTFEDVQTLTGATGSVTPPKLNAMGKYSFRIAIESGGAVVGVSAAVAVTAYGDVPLVPFNNGSGTVQVGNRLFSYTDQEGTYQYPQYEQNQVWSASTCRSITVQFTQSQGGQQAGSTGYLEFVQTSSDPAYASAHAGIVKSITVPLDGGPLYINTSSTGGYQIDLVATGSCYTPSGQTQT
ncbi:serine/threonine protein kinase [Trebonia kvetii]|uniref:non-specific serine/threonine protein kinase n=1 Tax=Trebonia kvetii TaxID=2480626 RepID=A0A6P2C1C3_9ACTN|nr:serine/threonine-protein kinase [Trebonia kvetii]TVZ04276.1 serine/threonine protein kinase [Trebonia kvetii]